MYTISANDLYSVVTLINRLPDRYITCGQGKLVWGIYNTLTTEELEKICSCGIKCE